LRYGRENSVDGERRAGMFATEGAVSHVVAPCVTAPPRHLSRYARCPADVIALCAVFAARLLSRRRPLRRRQRLFSNALPSCACRLRYTACLLTLFATLSYTLAGAAHEGARVTYGVTCCTPAEAPASQHVYVVAARQKARYWRQAMKNGAAADEESRTRQQELGETGRRRGGMRTARTATLIQQPV